MDEGGDQDEEIANLIKCIQNEGTELSFWQPPSTSTIWKSRQPWNTSPYSNIGTQAATCAFIDRECATVDAISDRMVTDIISEVTRKSSEDSVGIEESPGDKVPLDCIVVS